MNKLVLPLIISVMFAITGVAEDKRIVLIAGPTSHYYGAHDFEPGCLFLEKALEEAVNGLSVDVVVDSWPDDPRYFDGADAVIIYSDGLAQHVLKQEHAPLMNQLQANGVGIGFIHYACNVEADELGEEMLNWIGGYYEKFWSVNPRWVAEFEQLPEHPVTKGVEPFIIYDEWYYHMRFRDGMENVTPILSAIPPDVTRMGKDGAHSGNQHVRARMGMPEHVAWVATGKNGSRGFGFTGLHFLWNLGNRDMRRVIMNACLWLAKVEVPEGGIPLEKVTLQELMDLNPQKPDDRWNREVQHEWKAKIDFWNK